MNLVVAKTWRSELKRVIVLFILCWLSVLLSKRMPGSIIDGKLFGIGGKDIYLSLPLFWLIPFAALMEVVVKIYNVRFVIESRGIEARVGILSLNQRIVRVRFEDVRSVETEQTLMDRFLGVGNVEVGTAATSEVEILFEGVANPQEVQNLIQSERDKRHQASTKRQNYSEQPVETGEQRANV